MLPSFEQVISSPHQSFSIARYRGPLVPFRWHTHPEVELVLRLSGHGQRFVGDGVAEANPGDLVLLGGELPHTWYSPPCPDDPFDTIVIQFLPHFLGEKFYQAPEMEPIRNLLKQAARGLLFSDQTSRAVHRQVLTMRKVTGMRCLTTLLSLLSQLSDEEKDARRLSSREFEKRLDRSDQRRIDQIFNLVQSRIDEPLKQSEVAEAVHLSPGAFGRFFKRTTGHTFTSYVHELRIGRGCRMLIETDKSIVEICMASGFGNLSHFNRLFMRLKGISPREFRRTFMVHGQGASGQKSA